MPAPGPRPGRPGRTPTPTPWPVEEHHGAGKTLLDPAGGSPMSPKDRGRLGGKATLARYGRPHFQAIGRRGYQATLARHWQGDRRGFAQWLHGHALTAVADALADRVLAA